MIHPIGFWLHTVSAAMALVAAGVFVGFSHQRFIEHQNRGDAFWTSSSTHALDTVIFGFLACLCGLGAYLLGSNVRLQPVHWPPIIFAGLAAWLVSLRHLGTLVIHEIVDDQEIVDRLIEETVTWPADHEPGAGSDAWNQQSDDEREPPDAMWA